MDREALIEELREIIAGYLGAKQIELIDLVYRFEAGRVVLRIIADKPQGGINLEECAILNHELGIILDEKDLLQERYILEVSSPGLDRPLQTKSDFLRCLNRKIAVFLNQPVNGRLEIKGEIKNVSEENLYLVNDNGQIEIKLDNIRKGKQIISNN